MRRALLIIAVLAVAAMPTVAAAQSWFPIVPCGRAGQQMPCSPCHLLEGLENVSDLILFGVTGPIAAFMIVLAGGRMLLGGANPGQYSKGKEMLTNTLTGVTVILLAWVATNFLIKTVATGSPDDNWDEFTCPAFLSEIQNREPSPLPTSYGIAPPPPVIPRFSLPKSMDAAAMQQLASVNKAKYPRQNSPTLNNLIECIYRDPVVAALTFPKPPSSTTKQPDPGNFTYGNNYEACNYTHGYPILGGQCDHPSKNSCHYGGATGTNGAESIDLNALERMIKIDNYNLDKEGNPVPVYASEMRLFCELYRVLVLKKNPDGSAGSGCGDFKYLDMHNRHSHVTTKACDRDGFGVGSTTDPKGCAPAVTVPSGSGSGSSGQ